MRFVVAGSPSQWTHSAPAKGPLAFRHHDVRLHRIRARHGGAKRMSCTDTVLLLLDAGFPDLEVDGGVVARKRGGLGGVEIIRASRPAQGRTRPR